MTSYQALLASLGWLFPVLLLWSIIWKCYSMWIAARREDKWWFILLLVVNTLGILDIVYIFGIAKKKPGDMARSFVGLFNPRNK